VFILGIGTAIFLSVPAPPTPQSPLEYDPFASKKYLRELELYGGKINILAVEFRQWFESLWRGHRLSYTIALLTVMLSALLWFLGSHVASPLDTQGEQQQAPSDIWS
jgi:hypothetical protein